MLAHTGQGPFIKRPLDRSANKQPTQWPESASDLYWPSNRHLPAKLMPTFAERRV
jgi:hypothetical protein